MAITKIIGVEHLPQGVYGTATIGHGLALSDLNVQTYFVANYNGYALRAENGLLALGKYATTNTTAAAGLSTIPFKNLIGAITPNKVIYGFRRTVVTPPSTPIPMFAICDSAAASGTNTLLAPFTTISTEAAGSSNYYELELDFVAKTYTVYKDGVAVVAATTLPTTITKDTIANLYLGTGTKANSISITTAQYLIATFSDIYFIADTGDATDTMVKRLGSVTVARLPIKTATSDTAWTPSDSAKSVADVLNTNRASSYENSPYASSPSNNAPLKLTVDRSALKKPILGLSVVLGSLKDSGVTASLKANLSLNNVSSASVTVTPPESTVGAEVQVANVSVLPGGKDLSNANVDALQLVLTPS